VVITKSSVNSRLIKAIISLASLETLDFIPLQIILLLLFRIVLTNINYFFYLNIFLIFLTLKLSSLYHLIPLKKVLLNRVYYTI